MLSLKERLHRGDVLVGAWSVVGHPLCAEALAVAGAAYVSLDQQHGEIYPDATSDLLRAVGVDTYALVRVARNDPHLIGKALDQGADGVLAPLVENLAGARALRAASLFPPQGARSYGGRTRGIVRVGGDPAEANERIVSIAIIESIAGVEAIDEICSDGGVDAVYIGLNDLALSLGLPPRMIIHEGVHADAVERVAAAARVHGIAWGTHASPGVGVDELADRGAQLITACTDLNLIDRGAADAFAPAARYNELAGSAREIRCADRTSAA